MDTVKIRFTVAYDGTNYAGWQVQKTGLGVQQKVEEAFGKIFPGVKRIHSSSRTDTGVHAMGMVAHVEIPKAEFKMSVRKLAVAINAYLPPDIRLLDARKCAADFHARFNAKGKEYRYLIWNHTAMNPLLRHQAWHVTRKLDFKVMRAAAAMFVGKHDFRSFTANRGDVLENAVRTLTRCEIKRNGRLLTFFIEGDGFLYKMCRGIVGTVVQVGLGKFDAGEIKTMLAQQDRRVAGMTAPAHGLVLWEVFYK
jgi:tRNA pseudouridine38-40 synthase